MAGKNNKQLEIELRFKKRKSQKFAYKMYTYQLYPECFSYFPTKTYIVDTH